MIITNRWVQSLVLVCSRRSNQALSEYSFILSTHSPLWARETFKQTQTSIVHTNTILCGEESFVAASCTRLNDERYSYIDTIRTRVEQFHSHSSSQPESVISREGSVLHVVATNQQLVVRSVFVFHQRHQIVQLDRTFCYLIISFG